jgi:hypothetical protein
MTTTSPPSTSSVAWSFTGPSAEGLFEKMAFKPSIIALHSVCSELVFRMMNFVCTPSNAGPSFLTWIRQILSLVFNTFSSKSCARMRSKFYIPKSSIPSSGTDQHFFGGSAGRCICRKIRTFATVFEAPVAVDDLDAVLVDVEKHFLWFLRVIRSQ